MTGVQQRDWSRHPGKLVWVREDLEVTKMETAAVA